MKWKKPFYCWWWLNWWLPLNTLLAHQVILEYLCNTWGPTDSVNPLTMLRGLSRTVPVWRDIWPGREKRAGVLYFGLKTQIEQNLFYRFLYILWYYELSLHKFYTYVQEIEVKISVFKFFLRKTTFKPEYEPLILF